MTPFLRFTAFGEGRKYIWLWYLYPYQLPGRPSWLSLCFPESLPSSGFLVSAAMLPSNTRAAQILWLARSVHTVLGYIASIIALSCGWCRTVATPQAGPLKSSFVWPVQVLQGNLAQCYVKQERESVFTVVENECHHLVRSTTLCENRGEIFLDLSIVEVRIWKW